MLDAAGVPLKLSGSMADCMKAEIANKKAGRGYNPNRCLAIGQQQQLLSSTPVAPNPGGVPTIVWIGLGVAAVGGLAYYMMKRRPS